MARMMRVFPRAGVLAAVPAIIVGALGFALAAARPAAQSPAPLVDVQTIGPQVGDVVPDFSLRDQRGQVRTLQSVLGPKGAMLVFFRSADW